ncbi:3-oxoacid CoA-transferase subunit A [Streptococcus merionis]|uniref:3-oxoacid CoA-transferase subunit A n=1 Tax=Streptococcus merionis TaxID=400065 RepID=UPI0035140213
MVKNKVVSIEKALENIQDGATIIIGGFLTVGGPNKLVDALLAKGTKNLTLIANDTGFIDKGLGKLIAEKRVSTIYASHIGTNRETGRQMIEGETDVHLVPQGTLIEQIRAAGFGLGGILTPTGLGTAVQEGKQVIAVDGKDFLLEKPLKADVALVFANKADKAGNLQFHGSTQNFNLLAATAADYVLAEVDQVVEIGELDPDTVCVPSLFVDHVVDGGSIA